MKSAQKAKAIQLRKNGLSYSQILAEVPVAKSTLSLWLRDVGLTKSQKQTLTNKKRLSALRGAAVRRKQRIARIVEIEKVCRRDVRVLTKRDLWLTGVMLYWAEGAKEKPWRVGSGIHFANSDPKMIALFLKWLREIIGVSDEDIWCRIALHKNFKTKLGDVEKYWQDVTDLPKANFRKVCWKKHNPKTCRRNIEQTYYGLLDISVKASSQLTRQVAGWVKAITEYWNC